MKSTTWRTAVWIGLGLFGLWFLYAVRSILLPFVIGLLVAILLEPLIRTLRARGISRGISVNFVFLSFFSLATLALLWAIPIIAAQVTGFSGVLQEYTLRMSEADTKRSVYVRWNPVVQAEPPDAKTQIDQLIERNSALLERAGLPTTRKGLIDRYVEPYRANVAQVIQGFFGSLLHTLGSAASTAMMLIFAPLIAWLMLMDFERLRVRTAVWIPSSIRRQTLDLMSDMGGVLANYLRGVTVTIGTYVLAMAVVLTILQTPYSLILAILGGVLYLVPFVGAWISIIAVFLVTGLSGRSGDWLFTLPSPWHFAALCALAYFLVSSVFDQIVYPRMVGQSVGLNPIVSMFVVFSGGALFGLAGMVFAFPVAGAAKVMLERFQRASNAPVDALELPTVPLRHRRVST